MVGSRKVALSHQRGASIVGSAIREIGLVPRLKSYLSTGIRKRRPGGSVPGSVEVLVRRKKVESLTELAMEIRQLIVMAFPGKTDRTTKIVARDVFLDALNDPELTFKIHTQRPLDLDSAVQIAQYMKAVIRSLPSRSSKPVRAAVRSGIEGKIEAELRDLRAGQRHLLETLEQIGRRADTRTNQQPVANVKPSVTSPTTRTKRRAPEGDGTKRAQHNTACFAYGNEGHYAKNYDHGRSGPREPQAFATEVPQVQLRPRCGRTIMFTPGGRFSEGVSRGSG